MFGCIRWTRLTLAAVAASSLTVLAQAQAPADAGAPDLPRPANGADAIRLLGDDLVAAAEANGLSSAELRRILREDPSAWLDRRRAHVLRRADPMPVPPDLVEGVAPYPLDQTFLLHSRPASTHVIYLDFDGTTVSGTAWNNGGLPDGTYAGYSLDGSPAFNDTEKEQVQSVWQRVSEDYAAFDVDVTTQDPGAAAIDRTNAGDQAFGTRALISDDTTVAAAVCNSSCGGVAYIGVFDEIGASHSYHQPAFVFGHLLAGNDTKDIAEAVSHEVGHNFGLHHDGTGSAPGARRGLLHGPRPVGADHGRRLPEAAGSVEQGRVHLRQQHRERPLDHRRGRRPRASPTRPATLSGPPRQGSRSGPTSPRPPTPTPSRSGRVRER